MRYKARWTFTTTVQLGGRNTVVHCGQGDTIDLDEQLAAAVNADTGGALVAATTTKKGTSKAKGSRTRQTGAAPNRSR